MKVVDFHSHIFNSMQVAVQQNFAHELTIAYRFVAKAIGYLPLIRAEVHFAEAIHMHHDFFDEEQRKLNQQGV